jgi:hypothetical protein
MQNEIVYKYRDCENQHHRNALIKNEIYFSAINDFNDPFDSQIFMDILNAIVLEESELRTYLECKSNISKFDIEVIIDRFKNEPNTVQQNLNEVIISEISAKLGVFCLSKRWDNIKMWSNYGKNHKGFCIGYNLKKLKELISDAVFDNVNYSWTYPKITFKDLNDKRILDITKNAFFTKSFDWDDEDEFRIAKLVSDNKIENKRIINIHPEIISEIILGLNIDDKHEREIKELCIKREIPLFKTIKKPFSFEIERHCLV